MGSVAKIGPNWVEQTGQGEPVLFLAGLGYAGWCWREVSAQLDERFSAIRVDNRGAGQSDFPEGSPSIKVMADDAARVISNLNVGPAHVVGHSMGGYIALTLAKEHPHLVRSLVLVGTAGGGDDCAPVPETTLQAWHAASALPPATFARETMPLSFAPNWTSDEPEAFEDHLAARLEFPTAPEAWAAQFAACEDYLTTGLRVEEIATPSLVIHGSADRVVPYTNGRDLAERMPHGRFLPLEDAGHLCFLEDTAGFCRHLAQFFQTLPQGDHHA
jgi:3-oxoadipate enol-lactonase